jgi:site-specific recombinase XerD
MSTENPKRLLALKNQSFNIASVDLLNAWTDFILSRQAIQCSATTMRFYKVTAGRFITWLENQGITAPDQVTARHVRQYLALYADKSDWYLNGHARAIRTLLRFWHKEGYLPQPITFDMPKVRQKRLPFLTAEQVKQVLAVCNTREKTITLLIVDSGLRRQEVCNLKRSDIDLQTGVIRVRQGKGRKDRIVVIGATTRRALLKYWRECPNQADDAPAIQTDTGQQMTGYGLQSLLRRLSKKSGVRFSAHALRRTFATLSLKNGMDLVSLQTLLGHSNISTTRQYIQWLESDLLEAHRRHSPVDNL